MSGDMDDPNGASEGDSRSFAPPPPPVAAPVGEPELVEAADAGVAGAVPGTTPGADALPPVPGDDVLDAEAPVPDFTVPEPPEIPPLDATAADLIEEGANATEPNVPATRSELRAREAQSESVPGGETEPPAPLSPAVPVAPAPASVEPSVPIPAPVEPAVPTFAPGFADPGTLPPAGGALPFGAVAPPAFGEVPDASASDVVPPEGGTGNTYRGWPVVIYGILVLLLVLAVVGIALLVNNPPTVAESPSTATSSETATQSEAPRAESPIPEEPVEQSPAVVEAGGCSALCGEVSAAVNRKIIGVNDGVVWVLDGEWSDVDAAVSSASDAASGDFTSEVGELQFSVMEFPDDAAVVAAADDLRAQRADTLESEANVYQDGTGTSYIFADGSHRTVLWYVPSDDDAPWLMLLEGPDDAAVFDFYLSLPF